MFLPVLSHFSAIKAELTLTLQVAGWVFCTFFLLAVHPGPAEMPQPKPLLFKTVLWFYILSWFFFPSWLRQTQEAASRSFSTRVCSHSCLLSASCSLNLSHGVWFALLNSLPSPPPLSSTVNKQPVPAPRRGGTVNKKPQLTSPTFQPTLPPLEAWVPAQPEPEVPCPAAEAEQPSPSVGWPGRGDGGGGGLNGGVQVAAVKPQVVTQLSAEESR